MAVLSSNVAIDPVQVFVHSGVHSRPALSAASGPEGHDSFDVELHRVVGGQVHQRTATVSVARVFPGLAPSAKLRVPQLDAGLLEGCGATIQRLHGHRHLQFHRAAGRVLGPAPAGHEEVLADSSLFVRQRQANWFDKV